MFFSESTLSLMQLVMEKVMETKHILIVSRSIMMMSLVMLKILSKNTPVSLVS